MLMAGKNITQSKTDRLVKIQDDYLYKKIVSPNPDVYSKIQQLRTLYNIDQKAYASQKKILPYFTCGIFKPEYRLGDNFSQIQNFVIDIDHISQKGLDISVLKQKLIKDDRVYMCFLSPGEDGLKVMFRLKEPCGDSGHYSVFYKIFAARFSREYSLENVIDQKTCDVTRACFISFDKDAYFNSNAEAVDIAQYADTDNPLGIRDELFNAEKAQKEFEALIDSKDEKPPVDPSADILSDIKRVFGFNERKPRAGKSKNYTVPDQLEDALKGFPEKLAEAGLEVLEYRSINYGKKVRVKHGVKEGEINIFYSPNRHIYTVTKSTRANPDSDLNEILYQAACAHLELT